MGVPGVRVCLANAGHHRNRWVFGAELIDAVVVLVTEGETGDQLIACRDIELGIDGVTPGGEFAERAAVDAANLRRQKDGVEEDTGVLGGEWEHAFVDENPHRYGRAKKGEITASGVLAASDILTRDPELRVEA